MDTIFRLSNLLVLPFWALMILLPGWRGTKRIMRSPLVSVAPAALYVGLVLPRLGEIWPAIARPTLGGMTILLGAPAGATIAWIHFLAFDLLIGRWIYLDADERRISAWLTSALLLLTLMLGPSGFLLYLATRSATKFAKRNRATVLQPGVGQKTNESPVESKKLAADVGTREPAFLHRALKTSSPLTFLGGTMILTLLAATVAMFLDHRVISGAPAWLKPAKFALSVSVYCFTFVWLLGFVENHRRLIRLAANVTVVSFIVEMIVIIIQVARNTTSHFNMTTPLNLFLWMTMGTFIVFVWAMNLLAAILLLRQRIPDPAFAWSLRLGLLISLVGMATAFPMLRPTPEQVAAIAAGQGARIVGAHSVGVTDGGPGIPILGWSTVGGDLRAAHLVGLHGLQLLPFLGWLLRRRIWAARLNENHRLSLVWTAGFAYLGLVLLLMWQALRGQSIIHPDDKTMGAAAAIASLTTISILATVGDALRAGRSLGRHELPPVSEFGVSTLAVTGEDKV